jgi:hypothetical protein
VPVNKKDQIAATIFIVTGLSFSIYSWLWLKIGRAFRMGEGYFPIVLGLVLIGLGLLVAFQAFGLRNARRTASQGASQSALWETISWRALILITASIVYFGIAIRNLGLLPALAGAIVIAALATRYTTPGTVLGLAVGLTAFCIAVFSYGLGLPIDLIGPWLRWG